MVCLFLVTINILPSICKFRNSYHRADKSNNVVTIPNVAQHAAISCNLHQDEAMMRRCVDLASRAAGQTRPNPPVGCVITSSDGRILGEGFHRRAGFPHAEIEALEAARLAGNDVRGSTVYVSLEPCNHTGRTGPCAEALISAGVRRVVAGVMDPNPKNEKSGGSLLRENDIEFEVGIESERCRELVEGFLERVEKGTPLGVWKYAMTLDGRIATENGSSKWISGQESRQWVQRLREGVDAIIVGGNTVRTDNPRLTVRERRSHMEHCKDNFPVTPGKLLSPMRIIMTRSVNTLDPRLRIFSLDTLPAAPTVVLTPPFHTMGSTDGALAASVADDLRSRGVTVEEIPNLSPKSAMSYLYDRGALTVLWECGGNLAAAAVADRSIRKVHAFIAPKIIGGDGPSPTGKPVIASNMNDAWELKNVKIETFGRDVLVSGYIRGPLQS